MYLSNAEIVFNNQISSRYAHMKVEVLDWSTSIVMPGQFFHIRSTEQYLPMLRRPFSIYRVNKGENSIEFLYLIKGAGTKMLASRKKYETLNLLGPLGNYFTIKEKCSGILLVARGVGIATLSALAFDAVKNKIPCFAILSARTKEDILVEKELKSVGVITLPVNDEDGSSDPGLVERQSEHIIRNNNINAIYTCGSKRLSILMKEMSKRFKIYAEVALEEHMGCGVGACYACVCDIQEDDHVVTTRICQDGPVFPLKKVILT